MAADTPPSTQVEDHWIDHPEGRLYGRSWTPVRATAPAALPSPVVMFHDSLGSVDLWRDFPAALAGATGRRVIAYDRLGFGRSDPRPRRPSLDFIAEESTRYVPQLRQQLGIDRFVAFGHSVGGGMSIHCAAAFPQACEALVTESAQVFAEEQTLASIRAARAQFQDPEQVQRLARYHGDKARWVLEAWTENWLDPGFAAWSLDAVLPRVVCPVLAIHGEQDEYGSLRHPRSIGERAGGRSRVAILPATGHVPHRERGDDVLALVREFLAAG
jgi:pimeloyl-ACP methyl ester carboxylesterase